MTAEHEKIISLANQCGAVANTYETIFAKTADLIDFYKAAQKEAYETAAEIADSNCEDEPYGHAKFRCVNIATAIRQLKGAIMTTEAKIKKAFEKAVGTVRADTYMGENHPVRIVANTFCEAGFNAGYEAGYTALLNELELGDWCRDSDNAPLYALPEGVTKS